MSDIEYRFLINQLRNMADGLESGEVELVCFENVFTGGTAKLVLEVRLTDEATRKERSDEGNNTGRSDAG